MSIQSNIIWRVNCHSKSDPDYSLELKNLYEEPTTMEVEGSRMWEREKLNFKTALMQSSLTWLRVLEWILAVSAVPQEVKQPGIYTLPSSLTDMNYGGRIGGTDTGICFDHTPPSGQQVLPWKVIWVTHIPLLHAMFYNHVFTFCLVWVVYLWVQ